MTQIPVSAWLTVIGFQNRLNSTRQYLIRQMPPSGPRYFQYPGSEPERIRERAAEQLERIEEFAYFLERMRTPSEIELKPPDTLLGRHLSLPMEEPGDGRGNIFFPFTPESERLFKRMLVEFENAGQVLAKFARDSVHEADRNYRRRDDPLRVDPRFVILRSLGEPTALLPTWEAQPWRAQYLLCFCAGMAPPEICEGLGFNARQRDALDLQLISRTPDEERGNSQVLLMSLNRRQALGIGPPDSWRNSSVGSIGAMDPIRFPNR